MIDTPLARLRCGVSLAGGWPFPSWALDRLIAEARAARQGTGSPGADTPWMGGSRPLDEKTLHAIQLRRFRTQAVRGARETPYYGAFFARLGLDPCRLIHADIARLSLTSKEAVRDDPDAFVRRTAHPTLRTTTTGTTGWPTSVSFSARELRTTAALSALGFLLHGQITPTDIVQMNTSARATLGNTCFGEACTRIGASWSLVGLVDPAHALALLTRPHRLPGKKPRVSVLQTYASYLGELVTCGLRQGYRPADFGVERLLVGGEVVTEGLLARARALFGPVQFVQGYAMTETWPCTGTRCEQGHLHFEISQGLVEVCDLDTGAAAQPGATGTLVVTPFAPYREATVVLRYNTEDVVRTLAAPATCSLHHLPATSDLLGKQRLSVRHATGWTFPRAVLEALEAQEVVPLPARYGLWPVADGVGVEVVAPDTAVARATIAASLEAQGVPLRQLRLVATADELQHGRPLRCDLRENLFPASAPPVPAPASRA